MNWKPISEAPKDGTLILGVKNSVWQRGITNTPIVMYWCNTRKMWISEDSECDECCEPDLWSDLPASPTGIPYGVYNDGMIEAYNPYQWRPIKTAPKDGTYILTSIEGLYPSTNKPFSPSVTAWNGERWVENEYDTASFTYEPTHWMHLPPSVSGETYTKLV